MHYVDRSRSALFHSRDKLPILWLLYFYFGDLTWPNLLMYPSTHPTIHPPICWRVVTDFKCSNWIELSQFIQVLLNFYWFDGSSLGGGVDGWVVVRVCQGVWGSECPTHVCTHTYTHACACIHKWWCHNGNHQGKPITMGAAICMKLSCLYMCVSVCACAHVCREPLYTPIYTHTPILKSIHPSTPTRGDPSNQ